MKGLDMFKGREVNHRRPGESGIAEASRLRREKKRMDKMNTIADAIDLSKSREEMRNRFGM
jgi:hypothetical protein|tara:strand:- start:1458 stop:1640 length:183 start_codon:yes stop_codon:yes gene_type:complete